MDAFQQHEKFEIEVLDKMKSARLLEPLVFGGGTMLRLCHDLNRYSVDLDFWFYRDTSQDDYFDRAYKAYSKVYEITDAKKKRYTLLYELRSKAYPKRLKIEIRRVMKNGDIQEAIAYSKFATKQVALRTYTLNQMMDNKIKAFLDRGEIRDCFDIEFLLRNGIQFPIDINVSAEKILQKINQFKSRDFKVKLGSILEPEFREYYVANGFSYLKNKLSYVRLSL